MNKADTFYFEWYDKTRTRALVENQKQANAISKHLAVKHGTNVKHCMPYTLAVDLGKYKVSGFYDWTDAPIY